MNQSELVEKLSSAGVSDDDYLIGGSFDERVCLVRDDATGKWQVFNFDRGSRGELRTFENEDAACQYLYARMIEDYVMTKRLAPC